MGDCPRFPVSGFCPGFSLFLKPGGHTIIATFALDGPRECSDLEVVRWSPTVLSETLGGGFELIECPRETHQTPWGKPQAFVYCLFQHVG